MKLIKANNKEKGTWYFTTVYKASQYTDVKTQQIYGTWKGKGWTFEEVEDDNVSKEYINPCIKSPVDEIEELIKQLRKVTKYIVENHGKNGI